MDIPVISKIQTRHRILDWSHFARQWQNILGLVLVSVFIGVALFAEVLAPNPDIFFPSDIAWPDDPLYLSPHPPGDGTIARDFAGKSHAPADGCLYGSDSRHPFSVIVWINYRAVNSYDWCDYRHHQRMDGRMAEWNADAFFRCHDDIPGDHCGGLY